MFLSLKMEHITLAHLKSEKSKNKKYYLQPIHKIFKGKLE